MAREVRHAEKTVDPRSLLVSFSEPVQDSFNDLAEVAHKSEHFDHEISEILDSWSKRPSISLHEMIISLPLIAEQLAEHVRATGDQNAMDVWRGLCTQLPENGFAISQSRGRVR